ncbi:kinase-like domain-containing protein [Armillaria fumosa]|nr:kinase-like domain-containing protein [Armillaria fumosa]
MYHTGVSTLSEWNTLSAGSWGRALNSWTQIELDDGVAENVARLQVQSQIWSLIHNLSSPWRTVKMTPQPVVAVVMDVLQQELDGVLNEEWYRMTCMKCLRVLCKARGAVPSSLFLQDVTKEGDNAIDGGGFAVSPSQSWLIALFQCSASLQDIWKGHFRDTQVCLKVLRVFGTEEQKAKVLREFCQEALVWRQFRHPNLLPFLGVSEELFAPRYCLISPWMVNGNIISYLKTHPDHDRLTSLAQIAEGMKYLHNHKPPIVHADIRGANILVMDDLRCCLADFGLSLFAESQTLDSTSKMSKGSARWLAPEHIDPNAVIDQAYITARDIYAYGCTAVEIYTGKPPFSDIKNEPAVMLAVIAGRRPPRPQHLLQDGLWSLITTCLIPSPSQRPTAEQISKALADRDILADSYSFAHGYSLADSWDDGLIHTPSLGSTFVNFNDFTSSCRPTIHNNVRQPWEIPLQSPSPEPTGHVADSREREFTWITSASSTGPFYTLPYPGMSNGHAMYAVGSFH